MCYHLHADGAAMLPGHLWPGTLTTAAALGLPPYGVFNGVPGGAGMLPAGMLPASMAMYLPGCGLDLATSMQQQVALQQLQLQQQLQAAAQAAQAGLDPAFTAGMERQDRPPAALAAGITGPAARAGAVPSAMRQGMGNPGWPPAQPAPAAAGPKLKGKAALVQRAIPPFSTFSSLKQLWERYDSSDPLTGRMAWKKLEELHRSDWRPKQRRDWSIVMAFVREVLQRQVAAAGQRLTDGQVVDQMDQEREQQGVKVPGYLKALSSRQQGEGDRVMMAMQQRMR